MVAERNRAAASDRIRKTRMVFDLEYRTNFNCDMLDFSEAYETVKRKKDSARIADTHAKIVCLASPRYRPSLKGIQAGSQAGRCRFGRGMKPLYASSSRKLGI
jgi:hypothetical protein